MDCLWDPPNYQETINDGNNECQCRICLGYDVIKETALNEKSCIQVLKILINKADSDVIELEEELINLLSQLACTDDEFSDMFSMSLRVKIDFLELSIKKLKHAAGDFSPTSREPAESIDGILKAVFCRCLQKKDEQFAGKISDVASSSHQVDADNPLGEKEQMGSSSNANQIEKSERVNVTALEKHTISYTRVKIEEDNAIPPDSAKYTCPVSMYSTLGLLRDSTEIMKTEVNKFQTRSPTMTKDIPQNTTPRGNSICQNPYLETQRKWRHPLKVIKCQTDDDESIGSRPDPLKNSSEDPNSKPKIIRELVSSLENTADFNLISLEASMRIETTPYTLLELSDHTSNNIESDSDPKKTGNSNPKVKEEPCLSDCLSLSSTKTYKRRPKLDSVLQTSSCSPCLLEGGSIDSLEMDYYTVDDLKAIAKQRNMKRYSKLRKSELAQALGIKLTEGKKKQKRKEILPLPPTKGEPQ